MSDLRTIWPDKYRVTALKDFVFADDQMRIKIEEMIEKKDIPHLLLSGVRGTGKTTIAKILINAMGVDDVDVLRIDGSSDTGISTIRDEVLQFVSSESLSGGMKIVFFDEAEYLSKNSQAGLRHMMVEYTNCRFIFTCNYVHKLIPEMVSRVQQFDFQALEYTSMLRRVLTIMKTEGVKFSPVAVDDICRKFYPDMRKVLNALQQNVVHGVLQDITTTAINYDWEDSLMSIITNDRWRDGRIAVCSKVDESEWEAVYRFLYDNIGASQLISSNSDRMDEAIVAIANYLYKHESCSDSEINAAAMFITLGMIANGK